MGFLDSVFNGLLKVATTYNDTLERHKAKFQNKNSWELKSIILEHQAGTRKLDSYDIMAIDQILRERGDR